MILAWLILALSMAMVFFYFQTTCQRILHRQFEGEPFQSIANVIRLELPSLRRSPEEFGAPADYRRLRGMLQCDFLALTYLLKSFANAKRRYSEERLLTLYFRWQLLSLAVRRQLKGGEKKAILRLTSFLECFGNVVGQHMKTVGCGNSAAAH
jgi:hypothetical protein